MKAISLWQPWASLWLGPKIHETRHWRTNHRGWLLVHAALHIERSPGVAVDDVCLDRFGPHWRRELPRGALVGAVKLEHCQPCDLAMRMFLEVDNPANFVCGDFGDGRYAWRRNEVVVFPEPVPYKGRQGFFEVPSDAATFSLVV